MKKGGEDSQPQPHPLYLGLEDTPRLSSLKAMDFKVLLFHDSQSLSETTDYWNKSEHFVILAQERSFPMSPWEKRQHVTHIVEVGQGAFCKYKI